MTKENILETFSDSELLMIEKGKKHWTNLEILKNEKGGYIKSETIKSLFEMIIEDVWINAHNFYKKDKK